MDRRLFLKRVGLGGAAFALASGLNNVFAQTAQSTLSSMNGQHPNVIVILADDMGLGDVSCYPTDTRYPEAAKIRTPNLDSLAVQGVRFTQGYSTAPLCTPSRAGLMMGRYQQRVGWYCFPELLMGIPKDELTIADVLKSQGYATACIGKWHLGYKPEQGPLNHGFDRFFGFRGGQHDFYDPTLGDPAYNWAFDHDAYIYDQDKPVEKMEYLTDEITNQGIKFIEKNISEKKPFFLYLPYNAVHAPLQAKWDKLKPYADEKGGKFTPRDIDRAMVDSLDSNVGRILDRLMHLGIEDNTIVFFCSDNGGVCDGDGTLPYMMSFNGGLRAGKGFFWEGGIHEAMIMRWPKKIAKGQIYNQPVSHLDIFKTAIAAAGVSTDPKPLDGVDLVPYIRGEKSGAPHDVLFWGWEKEVDRWAVRKGKWKLTREIRDAKSLFMEKPPITVTELHDLDADPTESVDVSAKYPDVVKELMTLKDEFYNSVKPSIVTAAALDEMNKEVERRKEMHPESYYGDEWRSDGAPGHWYGKMKRLDP